MPVLQRNISERNVCATLSPCALAAGAPDILYSSYHTSSARKTRRRHHYAGVRVFVSVGQWPMLPNAKLETL